MECLGYDQEKDEYTLKMSKQDFQDVLTVVERVCATPELQDFTALGTYTLERTQEVADALQKAKKEAMQAAPGPDYTFQLSMRDFFDAKDVVLSVLDSMGSDLSPLIVTKERVIALGRDMHGIQLEDMEASKSKGRG